jgi:hypothetical protein
MQKALLQTESNPHITLSQSSKQFGVKDCDVQAFMSLSATENCEVQIRHAVCSTNVLPMEQLAAIQSTSTDPKYWGHYTADRTSSKLQHSKWNENFGSYPAAIKDFNSSLDLPNERKKLISDFEELFFSVLETYSPCQYPLAVASIVASDIDLRLHREFSRYI